MVRSAFRFLKCLQECVKVGLNSQALLECGFESCQPQPHQSQGSEWEDRLCCGARPCTRLFLALIPRRPPHTMKLWVTYRMPISDIGQFVMLLHRDRRYTPHNGEIQTVIAMSPQYRATYDSKSPCRGVTSSIWNFPCKSHIGIFFSLALRNPGKVHNVHIHS